MRIELTTSMAGTGFSLNPGDIVDKPQAEAERLMAAGYAVPVVEGEPLETATDPHAEQIETREDADQDEQPKPRRGRRRNRKGE